MVQKVWSGAIAFGIALTAGLPAFGDNVPYRLPVQRAVIGDALTLEAAFRSANFDLAMTRRTGVVPRIFVDRLPRDLPRLSGKARQEAFIRILLPLVAKANEIIARQRARYLAIAYAEATGGFLSRNERAWQLAFAQHYQIGATRAETAAQHIDVIPPSLIVAHAIQASDWGADMPAIEDNLLFDEFGKAGNVEYANLISAVMAHMYRVNTHYRFAEFRNARARARASSRSLSGLALADAYKAGAPELGDALTTLIRRYELAALDAAALPRDTGSMLVALAHTELVPERGKEQKEDDLYPSVYFDPERQDPSDRFANPLPDSKYGEELR